MKNVGDDVDSEGRSFEGEVINCKLEHYIRNKMYENPNLYLKDWHFLIETAR